MPRFGSDRQYVSNNLSSNTDAGGNAIISPDNGFGGSPLGPAAIAQSLYAIPNPLFNLTPPDVLSAVGPDNQIPYWSFDNYSNSMSGSMFFDSTAQTWAARLNPGTASVGEYITLKTRSYLINDSNLNLRQKALATITKVGTYSSTNQWNLVLTASYYDVTGAQLHSYAIGTAADNGTWTAITGNTTSGGTAVAAAAAYVDLDFTLTAAATVSGTAKVDIESLLLATSTTATGAFLVTQTYNASATWTRPTGVNYVSVVAVGGGGGGQGGGLASFYSGAGTTSGTVQGGKGGTGSYWAILQDIYVGGVASVSIGVGAGGAGGTANTFTKAAVNGTQNLGSAATDGAQGGATSFGAYLSVSPVAATSTYYGAGTTAGGPSGFALRETDSNTANGGTCAISAFTSGAPFTTFSASGNAGGSGTANPNTTTAIGLAGAANSTTGIAGGGAGAGGAAVGATTQSAAAGGTGSPGGGGGGGGGVGIRLATTGARTSTAGSGGAAIANTGSGGGAGGGIIAFGGSANYVAAALTLTSGVGGAGAAGFITIAWVA